MPTPKPTDDPNKPNPNTPPPTDPTPPADPGQAGTPPKDGDQPPPEPPKEPVAGKDDPLLAALFRDIKPTKAVKIETPDDQDKKPDAKPDEPAQPAVKPADKPADDPDKKPDKPAPKRKKKVAIEAPDPEPAPVVPAPVVPAPAPPVAPAADPDADYVKSLTSEQQDELAEAEVAARLFPDKYKNLRGDLIKFYRRFDTEAQRLMTEGKDQESEEFSNLVKQKPALGRFESKAVQRKIGEEAAVQTVRAELAPEVEEVKRKQQEIEFAPKVQRTVQSFVAGVVGLAEGDPESPLAPALAASKEKGEEWVKHFPLEAEICASETKRWTDMVSEFLLFSRQLRKFDPNDATHRELVKFVTDQSRALQSAGGKALIREGRTFLPRDQYRAVMQNNPAEADKYWTFNTSDILNMMAYQCKMDIEARIRQEEETATRRGFTRAAKPVSAETPKDDKAGQAAQEDEPKPLNPPRAQPKPAKGAAEDQNKPAPKGDGLDVVSTLRLRD